MADPAFRAKLKILENPFRDKETSPDKKAAIDFTINDAKKAAQFLLDAAAKAEADGSTVRIYKGKDDFMEVPGFTSWGSLWGDTGSWSPLPLDSQPAPAPKQELPF